MWHAGQSRHAPSAWPTRSSLPGGYCGQHLLEPGRRHKLGASDRSEASSHEQRTQSRSRHRGQNWQATAVTTSERSQHHPARVASSRVAGAPKAY
jgi:hypothetical protein